MLKYILYYFLISISLFINSKALCNNYINETPVINNSEIDFSSSNTSRSTLTSPSTQFNNLNLIQPPEKISIDNIEKICPVCLQPPPSSQSKVVVIQGGSSRVSDNPDEITYINLNLLHEAIDKLEIKIKNLEEKIAQMGGK
ncbi:hypothetical protein [Acinetobacter variabilis]|uniref:hypothetical protein n=1 Tax=Acinetobacter variabilis TaxID=70346 RepID=UPI0028A2D1BD|nr:hypothetical protein [Acinetobacter variabilis]